MGYPLVVANPPALDAVFGVEGVTIVQGSHPVLSYQSKPRSFEGGWQRANYVHPLYDLNGKVITEDFPEDHRHHRGVFWAWHQVWVGERRLGDAWVCDDFLWEVQSLTAQTPGDRVTLTSVTHWKSPDLVDDESKPISVVKEKTQIVAHASNNRYRVVDFSISLSALLDDVRIGGSEDVKGYGGFSPRIRMTGDEVFQSDAGILVPEKQAIRAGTWLNITREKFGLAILVHHQNPSVTEQHASWILRRARSMQNAVYPGREPVSLSRTNPTVLRYRLVIHDGSISTQTIKDLQKDFWQADLSADCD